MKDLPRHRDLGHLEGNVASVADYLRADLDELLTQAGQQPRLRRLRHRLRSREVAEVLSEGMELKADGVRHKCARDSRVHLIAPIPP